MPHTICVESLRLVNPLTVKQKQFDSNKGEIKMKRTCNNCKALFDDRPGWGCRLGYGINTFKGIPLEECPKPTTNTAYCKINK